jgi:F420-0:gamma-glutamyl ligase
MIGSPKKLAYRVNFWRHLETTNAPVVQMLATVHLRHFHVVKGERQRRLPCVVITE